MNKTAVLTIMISAATTFAADDSTNPAASARNKEAVAILKKAQAAVQKTKLVRYQASYKGTGWVKSFVPTIQGNVIVGERSRYDLDRFFCDMTVRSPDADEAVKLQAGSDGDVFFLIDPQTKTAYEDMDPGVLGSQGRAAPRLVISQFAMSEPFKDELKADKIELAETQLIEGERCRQVHTTSDKGSELLWYISMKDFLPRRRVRIHKREEKTGTTDLTITNLVVDPELGHDPFQLQVPHGYRKTDEFPP